MTKKKEDHNDFYRRQLNNNSKQKRTDMKKLLRILLHPSSCNSRFPWLGFANPKWSVGSIGWFGSSVAGRLGSRHSPVQTKLYVWFFGAKSRVLFRFLVVAPPPIAEPSKSASDNRNNKYDAQDYKDGPK